MIVKAYCVIAVVNVKPIYFNKTHVLACFFTIIEEKYNLLLWREYSLEVRFKRVWVAITISNYVQF